MTQSQVMEHLAKIVGISKKDAKLTLDELNTLVVSELKKEGSIRLAGLGIFRERKLAARVGRNPATGQQIKIPARTRLRFTPAKALKELVLGVTAWRRKRIQHLSRKPPQPKLSGRNDLDCMSQTFQNLNRARVRNQRYVRAEARRV
jgi:DNA-binding protein HU-beta